MMSRSGPTYLQWVNLRNGKAVTAADLEHDLLHG